MDKLIDNNRTYTQNRELSWLKFNERVLEEAADVQVPLLERLKFVSIFTSNLDEFFMIRVGSLFDLSVMGEQHRDSKSNMTPREQLEKIYEAVRYLYEKKTIIYNEIWEGLKCYGMSKLDFKDLATTEVKYIKEYYKNNIKPVLAPQIVDAHHPFPHIANKEVYCVCLLKRKHETVFGLLPVPKSLPEIIYLPGDEIRYIRTEKIIYEYINDVFSKYEMIEKNCICITRNADISTDDETFELTEDFRSRMKKMLHKRKRLAVVRLEANYEIGDVLKEILCQKFEIHENQIFVSNTPTKMGFVFGMFDKISPAQKLQLTYKDFKPAASATFKQGQSIIKQIKQKDALMFYPYESMYSFLQLIKEAANDPAVISIKITIYRLAKKAKLVEYLCAAAENGKEVNVLMELRARFDEQNNIDWSERLEDAGCKVVYGFDEYKVHSKLCLITMKERNGISYITQVGTGNYNEKTAELYTDLSLITANTEIGLDAVEFFKNISINNVDNNYKKLLVAPLKLKNVILELIDDEIKKGNRGTIFIKINSLTDIDFIDKLREASCAGVSVKLIVRGICCLLPNIQGQTENIAIESIVGRFLEHSRMYSFGRGSEQKLYISSADLMTRNTERRIEVACPILDENIKQQINKIMEVTWMDNVKARILLNTGNYINKVDSHNPIDSQIYFIEEYKKKAMTMTEVVKPKTSLVEKFKKFFNK